MRDREFRNALKLNNKDKIVVLQQSRDGKTRRGRERSNLEKFSGYKQPKD